MLELELDLGQRQTGAVGVHRHADLHSEAWRERRDRRRRPRRERALTRDRGGRAKPGEVRDRPAGEPERQPEAAADATGERRDREVRAVRREGLDESGQLRRRGAEVAVAQDESRQRAVRGKPLHRQVRHSPLSEPVRRAHELGSFLEGDVRRGIGRRVVGHENPGAWERARERAKGVREPVGFVPGSHDYRGHGGYRLAASY